MLPFEAPSTSQSSRNSSILLDGSLLRPPDSSRLRPEDAFFAKSPPRARGDVPAPLKERRERSPLGRSDTITTTSANLNVGTAAKRRSKSGRRNQSSSRRRGGHRPWKKLLWVKQSFPDNYTDEETFLDHLQRNPSLRPYEFWPLVADSTVILQHVCSVIIFVCCFTGIFQERVSPTTVVGWATTGTVAGWLMREYWRSKEEAEEARDIGKAANATQEEERSSLESSRRGSNDSSMLLKGPPSATSAPGSVPTPVASSSSSRTHSRNPSLTSVTATHAYAPYSLESNLSTNAVPVAHPSSVNVPPYDSGKGILSPRMMERLTTAKSAILIYFSLLGLSPILKSLTKSTSSDSIWALSSWLMCINVFTFDYGAGPEAKFPAPLSTNAALMASTVLASRLPSTTHVFSLTLFSIEVFGLFPVFRRHIRHHSWTSHLWLTFFLVFLATSGLALVVSGGGWAWGLFGAVLGALVTCLSMGLTSWWLIGLQRYKNEIHGPWDPARPVIGRRWD